LDFINSMAQINGRIDTLPFSTISTIYWINTLPYVIIKIEWEKERDFFLGDLSDLSTVCLPRVKRYQFNKVGATDLKDLPL